MINYDTPIIFSIGCEKDKELLDTYTPIVYEKNIQAGAILADNVVYEFRDDLGDDNISDRNRRYCEFSAIYWIWKNIKAPYIGICHYRRKFNLSVSELDSLIAEDTDIITTVPLILENSIKYEFCYTHYKCDWDIFMSILNDDNNEICNLAQNIYDKNSMHVASMGIFKYEVFDELCTWMFPILDKFYEISPEKFSIYQHRDVGFIGERLVSLFVDLKSSKLKVKESNIIFLNSKKDTNIDYYNGEEVDKLMYERFRTHRVHACISDYQMTANKTKLMGRVGALLTIYQHEKETLPKTFLEYNDDSEDLDKQLHKLDLLGKVLFQYCNDTSNVKLEEFLINAIKTNMYSYIYMKDVLEFLGLLSKDTLGLLLQIMEKAST